MAAERGRMTGRRRRKHVLRPLWRRLAWPSEALALTVFWQVCALLPPERA